MDQPIKRRNPKFVGSWDYEWDLSHLTNSAIIRKLSTFIEQMKMSDTLFLTTEEGQFGPSGGHYYRSYIFDHVNPVVDRDYSNLPNKSQISKYTDGLHVKMNLRTLTKWEKIDRISKHLAGMYSLDTLTVYTEIGVSGPFTRDKWKYYNQMIELTMRRLKNIYYATSFKKDLQ